MATVKTNIGSQSGKRFIVLTMGPKEAGSVLAALQSGASNANTENVASVLASVDPVEYTAELVRA